MITLPPNFDAPAFVVQIYPYLTAIVGIVFVVVVAGLVVRILTRYSV